MLQYFYHSIITKTVAGFGTLFNNVQFARYDATNLEVLRQKVPLAYGPKQKYIVKMEQDTDPELIRSFEMTLPRMSFEIAGINYDANRKINTIQKTNLASSNGSSYSRFEKVPYNLSLNLHIIAKNSSDAFQILEQILPYFGPDFNITFSDIGSVDAMIDVPISIGGVSIEENWDGSFEDRKSTIITIQFTAKLNLYGPANQSKVILQTDVNFHDVYTYDSFKAGTGGLTLEYLRLTLSAGITEGSLGKTGSTIETIRIY